MVEAGAGMPLGLPAWLFVLVVLPIVAGAALVLTGLFGRKQLLLGLVLVPGTLVGYVVGLPLGRHLDRDRLRFAVLAALAARALGPLMRPS